MTAKWWAVTAADGKVLSEGTVVANPLPDGLTAVPVDGPSDGRPWDKARKQWGTRPEPVRDERLATAVDAVRKAATLKALSDAVLAIVAATHGGVR